MTSVDTKFGMSPGVYDVSVLSVAVSCKLAVCITNMTDGLTIWISFGNVAS